jgi:hypothetical protein
MLFDFVQHGHYINPARINPMLLQAVMPIYFREKFRYTISVGVKPAILVSTGMLVKSSVTRHSPVNGRGAKSDAPSVRHVTVRLHAQEAERVVGCVGAVFGQREIHLQIDEDAITFSTRSYKPPGQLIFL